MTAIEDWRYYCGMTLGLAYQTLVKAIARLRLFLNLVARSLTVP